MGTLPWMRVLIFGLISASVHGALLVAMKPATGFGRDVSAPIVMAVRMVVAPLAAATATPLADTGRKGSETGFAPAIDTTPEAAVTRRAEPAREAEFRPTRRAAADVEASDRRRESTSAASNAVRGDNMNERIARPGLPAAPDYLGGSQLDPGPRPLDDIEPVFPAHAGQQQGSVVLRILVDEAGAVDNVAVVRSFPPGLFDRSAVDAFAAARFSPGRVLGVPVKSQITVEVEFTPFNRGAAVSGRSY